MKQRLGWGLGAIALLVLATGCAGWSSSAASQSAERDIRVVVLEGSPYKRGLTHGTTLKQEIHEVVERWKQDLSRQSGMDADTLIHQFLKETDFLPAIERWTPDLLKEVRGIADGAGVHFDTIYAFQLMDEIWLYMDGLAEACSAMGLARQGSRPTLLAQNMDLEPFRNGYQVVFHIKHPGTNLEVYALSCAGLIVTTGMNNAPLGVCVNAMSQMNYAGQGLPIAFIVRGLLERGTMEDAVDFLETIQHASGQNYILGDAEQVLDFEVSASTMLRYVPEKHPDVILHTNHPRINTDYNPDYRKKLEGGRSIEELNENTMARLAALERRMGTGGATLGIDTIKATLSSQDSEQHPVCRPHDEGGSSFTFGTVVQVLSESPEFHLAPGPPNVTPFQVFRFLKTTD